MGIRAAASIKPKSGNVNPVKSTHSVKLTKCCCDDQLSWAVKMKRFALLSLFLLASLTFVEVDSEDIDEDDSDGDGVPDDEDDDDDGDGVLDEDEDDGDDEL